MHEHKSNSHMSFPLKRCYFEHYSFCVDCIAQRYGSICNLLSVYVIFKCLIMCDFCNWKRLYIVNTSSRYFMDLRPSETRIKFLAGKLDFVIVNFMFHWIELSGRNYSCLWIRLCFFVEALRTPCITFTSTEHNSKCSRHLIV